MKRTVTLSIILSAASLLAPGISFGQSPSGITASDQATLEKQADLMRAQGRYAQAAQQFQVAHADGKAVAVRAAKAVSTGQGRSLVIQSSESPSTDRMTLQEDMAVMLRVLDKSVSQNLDSEPARKAMGINLLFSPGSNPVRSLYLDGYGALFFLNVSFPLLPPPAKPEVKPDQPKVDSSWEEARREIYGEPAGSKPLGVSGAAPVEEYDEAKVTKLKEALLGALKDAANIRDLKGDDYVTLCVFGGPNSSGSNSKTDLIVNAWTDAQAVPLLSELPGWGSFFGSERHDAGPRATTMTLRAKKSDAEAFSKDKLTLDEFRKKVSVAVYGGDKAAAPAATKR